MHSSWVQMEDAAHLQKIKWRKVDISLTEKYNLFFNTNHKENLIIDIWKTKKTV